MLPRILVCRARLKEVQLLSCRRSAVSSAAEPRPPSRRRSFTSGEKNTFNILSLDGGGVRGAFTATVLARLEKECGPNFIDSFDLIAGTSTGAVLALCLARGMTITEVADKYRAASPEIFASRSSAWVPNLSGNLFRAKYENHTLRQCLQEWLGDTELGELNKNVVLTAFNVHGAASSTHRSQEHSRLHHGKGAKAGAGNNKPRWRPAVFSNLPTVEGVVGTDQDLSCVDAALRSTAAPTFFPIYQGYCDGAMTANNPSLVAVSKALAHFPGVLHRENVRVLSLGAGSHLNSLTGGGARGAGAVRGSAIDTVAKAAAAARRGPSVGRNGEDSDEVMDWGIVNWAPHLISLLMDSSALSTDLLVGLMIGHREQYHRLECALVPPKGYTLALDEVRSIPVLEELAHQVDLTDTVAFVNDLLKPTAEEKAASAAAAAATHGQQQQQQQQQGTILFSTPGSGPTTLSKIPAAVHDKHHNYLDHNHPSFDFAPDDRTDEEDDDMAVVSQTLAAVAEISHLEQHADFGFGGSSMKMRYHEHLAEVDDAWEVVAKAIINTKLPKEHRLSEIKLQEEEQQETVEATVKSRIDSLMN